MTEPAYDLIDRGGKRWRPILGLIMAELHGRDIKDYAANKDIYFAAGLTEIVHTGTLMVDDVMDSSIKRRGNDCTHIKYGTDIAINTGNFMYFAPMAKSNEYIQGMRIRDKATKIYLEELTNVLIG